MDAEEIVRELGIDLLGEYAPNDQYIIDIPDSKAYLKVYSKLDKSEKLEELDENSLLTEHNVSVTYLYEDEDTEITLLADLDNEEYKLVVNKFVYEDDDEDYDYDDEEE